MTLPVEAVGADPGGAATSASAGAGTAGTNETLGAHRIRAAFAAASGRGRAALIPYVVAGYPDAEASLAAALAAIDGGAELLEVGLPYSDPLADGTTLQRASATALRNGATFARSVELIRRIHAARPEAVVVAMTYANQVLISDDGRGALSGLAEAGASGVILADLTPDEGEPVEAAARAAGLALVYLVTPTTERGRRGEIARRSGGFLYAVSLVGVTGARRALPRELGGFLRELRADSPVPVAVGFGISRPDQVRRLARAADGVIVASALVDALGPDGRDVEQMRRLLDSLSAAAVR